MTLDIEERVDQLKKMAAITHQNVTDLWYPTSGQLWTYHDI